MEQRGELHVQRVDGWLAAIWQRDAEFGGIAEPGPCGEPGQPAGGQPDGGLHGAECESAERERHCGRRDLPGDGICAAGDGGCQRSDGNDFDEDDGLREYVGRLWNAGTSAALSDATWTKVQGTFSYSNFPGPPSSLVLYLQSSSATDSFYVSGVTISEIAPPPPNPSQQDNSGITSTFEDGGTDGWSGRAGSTVTNVTTTANSGTHSLLVQGRTHNYDGPQLNVSDKMYPGSTYNLSVWVKLVPTDGSVHTINMSLQTTLNGNTSYPSVTPYPGVPVPADGNWHQINVMGYTMANSYDSGQAYLYLQTVPSSGNDLVSFYVHDFQLSYVPPLTIQTDIPSIAQTYSNYFPIGAAVDTKDLTGPHAQLLEMHFNSMTPGNDFEVEFCGIVEGHV